MHLGTALKWNLFIVEVKWKLKSKKPLESSEKITRLE